MKTMLIISLLFATNAFAAKFTLDTAHSEVGFSVKHLMISKVKGKFKKFESSFDFDSKKGELKDIDVKIDATTIDTNNAKRDEHLTSPDFFDVKKYPQITFKSDKVESKDGKPVKAMGTLTMNGKSNKVTLDIDYGGVQPDGQGGEKVGFSATTKINRKDYNVNWNKSLDKGGVAVSDEVAIEINGEAGSAKTK